MKISIFISNIYEAGQKSFRDRADGLKYPWK